MAKAAATSEKKRRYHSPRRREQAEATRNEILDAAERLFIRDGYVATSMAAIAKEAGVGAEDGLRLLRDEERASPCALASQPARRT